MRQNQSAHQGRMGRADQRHQGERQFVTAKSKWGNRSPPPGESRKARRVVEGEGLWKRRPKDDD